MEDNRKEAGSRINDTTLDQLISSPTLKTKFEAQIQSSLTQDAFKGEQCETVTDFSNEIEYNASNFQILVKIGLVCNYKADLQKQYDTKSAHMLARVGLNESSSSFFFIVAKDKSWALNSDVYTQMADSFKGS